MKISVCIPMYNESKIIAETANALSEYMGAHFDDYEIIFSNDGSEDGCEKIVEGLGLRNVRVVGYKDNRGKGCAVRTAVMAANGDIIMFTDADLAYGTEVIKRFFDRFSDLPDTDILIGSRSIGDNGYEGYTFVRKMASKLYVKILSLAGGFKLSDSQCGCKAFRKEAAKEIFSKCEIDGFSFDFEVILRAQKAGKKISEEYVKIINHRESKVRVFRDAFHMLNDLRRIKKKVENS